LGFYKQKSHDVVAINACPLLTTPLNKLLEDIRTTPWGIREDIDQIKVIAGDSDSIATEPLLRMAVPTTTITIGNAVFIVRGDSFFQNNIYLSEVLGTWAHNKVSGDTCVDLYGGLGFFSILLGKSFSSGILIESVASQIRLAQQNFTDNGLSHFTTKAQMVEDFLEAARIQKRSIDCCIVDPPRSGLSPAARKNLAYVKPKYILYISCNPSTQARDAGFLVNTGKYRMTHCAVFDLYPNTSHLETAVILQSV
jgi:tRNA/tmRNA/rRNA uracil-C5-methylase (TrmA/RlmC/RlmD family)